MAGIRIVWLSILLGVMLAFQATIGVTAEIPDPKHKPDAKAKLQAAHRSGSAAGAGNIDDAVVDPTAQGTQLRVEVYYEALCPDSKQFVRNQLHRAMMDNNLLQHTDLVFVPYGKVSSWFNPFTLNTTLYCQHGSEECELNAVHACLLENNPIDEQVKMINCLMGSSNNVEECASLLNIDISGALRCKAHRSTPDILRRYGEMTNEVDISVVPTVIIDGEFTRTQQRRVLYNFMGVFCAKYKAKFGIALERCQV